MDLEVTEVGTGDRLVVFVHGVLGHGRSFDRVAELLDDECTMRRYDRRDDDARARRRIEAGAFLAEERSVRVGAPYDVGEIRVSVVYGRSGAQVMPEVTAFLAARIRQFELFEVPDAGHHAHRSAPEAFADLVRRGIRRA